MIKEWVYVGTGKNDHPRCWGWHRGTLIGRTVLFQTGGGVIIGQVNSEQNG